MPDYLQRFLGILVAMRMKSICSSPWWDECSFHCRPIYRLSKIDCQKKIRDKNSLFDRGSIGEMGLWVKGKTSKHIGVFGESDSAYLRN
jgi:hypothetical protein